MSQPEFKRGPWTCRWASVAGAVKSTSSLASPDVIWTCDLRDQSTDALLFDWGECARCGQWEPSAACAATAAEPPTLTLLLPGYARRSPVVAKARRYARGERIFDEGATTDFFYTSISGSVKLVRTSLEGNQSIVGIASGICPLNPDALDHGRSSSVSAVALDDATCVLVPKRQLVALFEKHPKAAERLYRELCERLESSFTRIADLSHGTVEVRLAKLFVRLTRSAGRIQGDATFIPVRLSRRELADAVGTTIETCIRLMSRWNKGRLVCTSAGGFIVGSAARLEALAQATVADPRPDGQTAARKIPPSA